MGTTPWSAQPDEPRGIRGLPDAAGSRLSLRSLSPSHFERLYAYNRWANRRLLNAAASLSEESLVRDLGPSFHSVFGTLQHILWSEWIWLSRWRRPASPGPSPLECSDLANLKTRWLEVERDQSQFLQVLTPQDLDGLVSYENPPGTSWTYTLQQMLQHVVNHSTYHRGQVAGMLRQLGNDPPPTDYLVYFDELAADAGRVDP